MKNKLRAAINNLAEANGVKISGVVSLGDIFRAAEIEPRPAPAFCVLMDELAREDLIHDLSMDDEPWGIMIGVDGLRARFLGASVGINLQ